MRTHSNSRSNVLAALAGHFLLHLHALGLLLQQLE